MDRPWVVVAFSGWNDAGSAATQAATLIAEYSQAKTWRTIDGEEFHDFRQARPAITVRNDVEIVNWPRTTIRIGSWQGQQVVVVTGPEPSFRWRTYCFRLLRQLHKLNPAGLVVLGAMATDVAHTRQLPVMVSTSDPSLISTLGAEKLEYDGPTGIPFVLVTQARRFNFNALGLWVGVPQYACESPCPPAVQALLVRIEELTGIAVPQAGLDEDKRDWVEAIDEALSEHPELVEYVTSLETEQDAALPEGLTGDVLAVEFQSYLRHRTN
ncbi:proteasome assembly chaperone family protein [Cutibacterium sp.]|uniref:proteasome assembly chaperone family protein n=1 Tax=Cutibacterium sp. TaxID=1912221 RepID=UPI0034C6D020